MRWLSSVGALLIAAAVGGCAIIEAEKDNRGGFLDVVADDLWMKADSKKMRALRALAIEASLARIAMITPKSAPDRALLARRIGETSKRADLVRRCAFVELPEPCFFFDSVMVDYENALFDLAIVALPIDDARNLLTRVSGGVAAAAINPLELVQALLDIGREAFRVGRVVGAIYRDTLELEVQVWLSSPHLAGHVAGLRDAYDRGNDHIPTWRAEIAALRAQGLEPVPDPRFIAKIFGILTYICGQIVNKEDPSWRECAQPDLTQNIQVATGPGGALFRGPVVVVGGQAGRKVATGGQAEREAATAREKAAKQRSDEQQAALTNQDYKRIIAVYNPRVHITALIKPVLRKICVPETELDLITAKTVAQVKVYQQTAQRNVTGLLTEEEIALLQNIAACQVNKGFLNFYEANEGGEVNTPAVIDLLNKALPNGRKLPKPSTVSEVRARIPEARGAVARSLQISDPQVANQLTLDLITALANLP